MIKVIGAGFGRTGTTSLKVALEQLGFGPCYHMEEVIKHIDHVDLWLKASRGQPVDWEAALGDYQAGVDFPVSDFYDKLMERYPDAKVLLSVRDADRWYESASKTIFAISQGFPMSWMGHLLPRMGRVFQLTNEAVWNGFFGGRFRDKAYAIELFHRRNEEVRRRVPPERLLVFDVKEGWEPLCKFLGVAVPSGPFPHLNDTAEFVRRVRLTRIACWVFLLLPPLALAVAAYLLLRH